MTDRMKKRIEKAKEVGLSYERLFEIAYALHLQIFHLTANEQDVYDEIGLTDLENALLGYGYLGLAIGKSEKESENK